MKNITLALLLSSIIFISLHTQAANKITTLQLANVITFGTEGTYAPYTYHDSNDKLVGFDVDLGYAVAAHLGMQAKFIEGRWDGLIAGLDSKRYDAVINQVGITPERKVKYDFSQSYIYSQVALITRNDNTTIKNFTDLKNQKSAQNLTSHYSQLARQYGADIVPTDNFNQSLELVITGRAAATLNDYLSFLDFKKHKPDAKVKIVALDATNSQSGIMLRKGKPELVAAINQALDEIKANGTYKIISLRYFGQDISQ